MQDRGIPKREIICECLREMLSNIFCHIQHQLLYTVFCYTQCILLLTCFTGLLIPYFERKLHISLDDMFLYKINSPRLSIYYFYKNISPCETSMSLSLPLSGVPQNNKEISDIVQKIVKGHIN